MSDLEMFKQILENQAESGIRSGDWQRCEYEEVELDRAVDIKIPSLQIAFRFRITNGRFIGVVNWKE
jgi:hypothetical protein